MIEKVKKLAEKEGIRQLIKYGAVGSIGLAIDLGIFYLLAVMLSIQYPFSPYIGELLGMQAHVIDADTSHIISSIVAIINNFILNSYFTFKVTDNKLKRFFSFFGVAAIGLAISTVLVTLFVGVLEMNEMPAKILATCIVAAIQFVVNKFFTFRQQETK